MSKKVVFIYINAFGAYPIIYEYCAELSRLGYEVAYIGINDKEEQYLSSENVQVFHLESHKQLNKLSFARSAVRLLRSIKPDLVHVFHYRWSYLIPVLAGGRYNFLLDVRTVHVADKKGRHSPLTIVKNRITWFESQFFGYVIALTKDVKKILLPSFKSIPIIPLGANFATFSPLEKERLRSTVRDRLQVDENSKVFLYSGTLNPIRRIDILIQAFAQVNARYPSTSMIIAGDDKDDPQTLPGLKDLAASAGLSNRIVFTGFILYKQLVGYYLASDIGLCYVPQTPFYDLQPPTKLFEYIAANLTVIATRTTANMEIIRDGENGYLANDDVNSLADRMCVALQEYKLSSARLKAAALADIGNYSWEQIIKQQLLPVYNRILKHKVSA